jgi:hypothetical protein
MCFKFTRFTSQSSPVAVVLVVDTHRQLGFTDPNVIMLRAGVGSGGNTSIAVSSDDLLALSEARE